MVIVYVYKVQILYNMWDPEKALKLLAGYTNVR